MTNIDTHAIRARAKALIDARCDSYGSFQGGDPRLFVPDPECSTEAERAAHAAACEAWERGERPPDPQFVGMTPDGRLAFIEPQGFGLGSYPMADDDAIAVAQDAIALADALDALAAGREDVLR